MQLKCINGHSYDLSREGYVNLVGHAVKTHYNKQLFTSRKSITQKGFFKPLRDFLVHEISLRKNSSENLSILDAGCGEGSLFSQVLEMLRGKYTELNAIGADLAKEGIKLAGRDHPEVLWMVANLADLPLTDNKVDVILNLLAPASYYQFCRVLSPRGILIKVIPGKEYLKELRDLYSIGRSRHDETVPMAISLFEKQFRYVENKRIMRTISVEREIARDLTEMTPLLWNLKDKKEKILELKKVTLDLHVLISSMDRQ